jgi:hypothetical protein
VSAGSEGKERTTMSRNLIYKEIEANFGLVPSFFDSVPDSSLELEWRLFKRLQYG